MNYKKYLLTGIPILFIIGSIFHFIYEWSGNNILIGFISPKNESIWEHLKLAIIPMTIYWLIYPLINSNIPKNKWLFSLLISILSSILTITTFYYTYTGALGIHSLILDIFSLLLGIAIGHLLGIHVFKYGPSIPLFISLTLIFALFIIFSIFTITPPNFPIFQN